MNNSSKISLHVTNCGIPGIGSIPFGIHLCHFYPTRQHLIDTIVPYVRAGLRNNERCLWIAAPPLPAADATAALRTAVPSVDLMIKEGRIRIIDFEKWYADIVPNGVIGSWLQEEEKALALGYQGLRITGNTSFFNGERWTEFMDYENAINATLLGRRIVVLCSYNTHQCRATQLLQVVRNHDYTLDQQDTTWEILRRPLILQHPPMPSRQHGTSVRTAETP
jgi:two-component system, sensor histidine kinase PdtaS